MQTATNRRKQTAKKKRNWRRVEGGRKAERGEGDEGGGVGGEAGGGGRGRKAQGVEGAADSGL